MIGTSKAGTPVGRPFQGVENGDMLYVRRPEKAVLHKQTSCIQRSFHKSLTIRHPQLSFEILVRRIATAEHIGHEVHDFVPGQQSQ